MRVSSDGDARGVRAAEDRADVLRGAQVVEDERDVVPRLARARHRLLRVVHVAQQLVAPCELVSVQEGHLAVWLQAAREALAAGTGGFVSPFLLSETCSPKGSVR